jgi:hypothetical protein
MKVGKPVFMKQANEILIPKMAVSPEEIAILDQQLKSLTPQFILSEGASISDNGVSKDFSQTQSYKVTSEDGEWTKNYTVSFYQEPGIKKFNFYFELLTSSSGKKYHEFYELNDTTNEKLYIWASGNASYALIAPPDSPPENYPTHATNKGKNGSGVQLTTCTTGALGALVKIPMAAGNLFLGTFDASKALTKPMEATQFGISTTQAQPLVLSFWGKYKAGTTYKDKGGNVLPLTDRPEIYAVLYEIDNPKNPVKLNGYNVKTAENIISIAELSEEQASFLTVNDIDKGEYKYLEIPFVNRKEFDEKKRYEKNYYITIVFSSSAKGNLFEGAVGSTLVIDDVELITKRK